MMIDQTDPKYENNQGRIPCWLSGDQIDLIIAAAKAGRENPSDADARNWADIQFRLSAAKHKFLSTREE